MKNIAKTIAITSLTLASLAGTASAQKAMNIGPGPGNIVYPPVPIPITGCPAGAIQQITVDPYGRQVITCVYPAVRPINPVGAIIGGIVGGIIAGGHRN